jgi:hypothetical protein
MYQKRAVCMYVCIQVCMYSPQITSWSVEDVSLAAMQGSVSVSNVRYYPTWKHSPLKERNEQGCYNAIQTAWCLQLGCVSLRLPIADLVRSLPSLRNALMLFEFFTTAKMNCDLLDCALKSSWMLKRFRKNISPSWVIIYPEDGADMFIRNVCIHLNHDPHNYIYPFILVPSHTLNGVFWFVICFGLIE